MASEVLPSPEWRAELRATLALALPLIAGNLAQAAIGATDLIYLGHLGPDALAAAALGFNLYVALMIFGIGFITAVSPMIAAERGRRQHSVRDVRRTVRQGLWLATLVSLPMLTILWFAEDILLRIGEAPELARGASIFVRAIEWGLLPFFFHLVLRLFVSALERPMWSLIVLVGTIFANALFGWVLIFGHLGVPPLGLFGAGLASTLANCGLFLGMAALVTLHPLFRRYRLFGRFWVADWTRLRALWALGFPIGVTLGLEVTVFNAAVLVIGLIGRDALAAHAVAIQLASVAFMVPLGLAQAATVRVGLAAGASDEGGVTRAGWTALTLSIIFAVAMAVAFVAAPEALIGVFLDTANPGNGHVLALATTFLSVAAVFQVVDGVQAVGAGCLRGLQDTLWPMVYAAFGYWVIGIGVGLVLAFRFGMGGLGIWIGLASGLAVVAVLMLGRWVRRDRLSTRSEPAIPGAG